MQNFWSIIWIVVWSFLFIAYLMIFFRIITDLFSDHEVSGWVKAIWIIALIFVPFLTALIYLITRGKGMAERQMGRMREMQSQQDAYIRDVAAKSGGGKSSCRQHRGREGAARQRHHHGSGVRQAQGQGPRLTQSRPAPSPAAWYG